DDFWERADVELEGDAELQQAVRFGLFHTLQAGARAEQRAIAAKGLTGPGDDGHTFWDTQSLVFPVPPLNGPPPPTHPPPRRPPPPSAGATGGWIGRGVAPGSWATRAPPSHGERFAERKARGTGPPARRPSTSAQTSPTRWRVARRRQKTTRSNARPASSCWL